MGNVCRICHSHRNKMTPLIEKSSNLAELRVEGEEFEYCFGLEVLEVPEYTEICTQCQEQLHSFYLFKQKAIKSHYELLHKAKKVKKKDPEIELSSQPENIERTETENLKGDSQVLNEPIKNEFEEADDDELHEIEKISFEVFANEFVSNPNIEKKTDKVDDNSRLHTTENFTGKVVTEAKKNSKLKFSKSKKRCDEHERLCFQYISTKFVHKCEICCKRFAKEETHKAHMNTHKGLPAYSCEICGKGFNTKESVVYHMKNHNNQRDFICEVCSKAYLSKFDLRTHMKCHNDQKQYICDKCGKLFRFSFQLNVHKESHSEEKHECSICHAKLHTRGTLKGHMRAFHGQYTNPKLFCTLCQKQFNRKYRFTAHMTKKHPEVQSIK